jgi:uncharacterized protein (DUF1501 family)
MFSQDSRNGTRRQFLGAGVASTLGLALSPVFQGLLAREGSVRRAKACILIWLNGGPSHIDTFDPKPGQSTNGPFKPVATTIRAVQFSEHLRKTADQAKHLAVMRSVTSEAGDHGPAYRYLHTGNLRDESLEFPSLGSVVTRQWSAEDSDLPAFVAINGTSAGPGFLGVQYSPHVITNLDAPVENLALPEGVDEARLARRLTGLEKLSQGFAKRTHALGGSEHESLAKGAFRFRTSPALKAFQYNLEKADVLAKYGAQGDNGTFGKACVMARRLVEHGVRFVEVMLDGWDTHADNFNAVTGLLKVFDPAYSALIADLATRGLLNETLVVCMGDFGRTPAINAQQGRDHWNNAFSVVLAGGGVRGGRVIGSTDAKGEQVKDRPVTVPDLYATLLSVFGVDPHKAYRAPGGRPIKLADKGKVVKELFV